MKQSPTRASTKPAAGRRAACLLAAALFTPMAGGALAQAWPAKPIRLILPYGPGGGSDVVARPLGHHLSQRLGQQVLVDNRGGANGNIAMEMVARAKPGAMTYGSTGNGSGLHLSMELLKSMSGIDIVHAPYKSAGAAMTDMLGEQLQAMFVSYGAGVGHFKAGRVRPLGATTAQRSKALPDIPTIAEAGLKGYESSVWYALLGPRGTPPEIVKRLNTEIGSLIKAELGAQFEADGITPSGVGPEQLAAFVRSESQKWGKVVKQSGAKLD